MAAEAAGVTVLVDTSVWIDHLRGVETPATRILDGLFEKGEDVAICGVVLTEILQGIPNDREYGMTLKAMEHLTFLSMGTREVFVAAARIYRSLRKRGITVRKPIDCMIAAVAIASGASLLHNDRDFDPIASHCGLSVAHPRPRRP